MNNTQKISGIDFPLTKECHCGDTADKYMYRKYVNKLNQNVIRIFYRCRNCWSRISEDFIPEMDNKNSVNVLELLKKYRSL